MNETVHLIRKAFYLRFREISNNVPTGWDTVALIRYTVIPALARHFETFIARWIAISESIGALLGRNHQPDLNRI